jgi:hypothetical protein
MEDFTSHSHSPAVFAAPLTDLVSSHSSSSAISSTASMPDLPASTSFVEWKFSSLISARPGTFDFYCVLMDTEDGFCRARCKDVWIVRGYNDRTSSLSYHYFHVLRVHGSFVCECSAVDGNCWHFRYVSALQGRHQLPESDVPATELPIFSIVPPPSHCDRLFSVMCEGENQQAIIRQCGSKMFCQLCKTSCQHSHLAKQFLKPPALPDEVADADDPESDDSDMSEPDEATDYNVDAGPSNITDPKSKLPFNCISHTPLPVPKWAVIPTDPAFQWSNPPSTTDLVPPTPDGDSSACCSQPSWSKALYPQQSTLYLRMFAIRVNVYFWKCSNCDRRVQYDGSSDGIFNYSNRSLFEHDLLNSYTQAYTVAEMPFFAYHKIICRDYVSHDSKLPFVSYNTFERGWFAFINLQVQTILNAFRDVLLVVEMGLFVFMSFRMRFGTVSYNCGRRYG